MNKAERAIIMAAGLGNQDAASHTDHTETTGESQRCADDRYSDSGSS